jgi:alkanesulfonate monooxygenase SsuD/methylene tetrahydromethanopterin reductase-like flavin-dependent oxidoreductase (luciferase family)
MSAQRQMTLVAFLQAQNCTNFPASWRHPAAAQDFMTPEYYQRIGRTLEDGKFQLAFFDDRLAIPDVYADDFKTTLREGIRAAKLDPVRRASALRLATSRLGIGVTYSTTYYEPFHVARIFSTLDQMTRGRAAWNVVTSLNGSEAANFGRDVVLEHDLRYDRAEEFAKKKVDEPLSNEEMQSITGLQAFRDRVVSSSGRQNPTPGDFAKYTQRGTLNEFPVFSGTATEVADQMEEWFGSACDGFVLAGSHAPGSYDDFVRLVVPELQRRGLFHREYEGQTLRENLGMAQRPA